MEQYLTIAPVASVIFALTIIISLVAFSNDTIFSKLILHPYEVAKGKNIYTLITSGFIHNDWMHLIFNMLSYFFFAFRLEATIGHWQFAILYIVSMVLSDLPSVAKHKNDYWYRSLGASGAISAVIFGYILYQPLASMMLLILPIPIPAVLFGILYLIYCTYASKRGQDNINHDAHLFGALSGIMITAILDHSALPTFVHAITEKVQSLLH